MGRNGLAFDHVMDAGRAVATMQLIKMFCNLGIGMGQPLAVADIFDPGRHMIAFRPDARVFEITQ